MYDKNTSRLRPYFLIRQVLFLTDAHTVICSARALNFKAISISHAPAPGNTYYTTVLDVFMNGAI